MPIGQNRIVIDTNLWISYLITKGFKRLDKLIYTDKVRLIFSPELISEFIEVAQRPKFRKFFDPKDISRLIEIFDTYGDLAEFKAM